MSFLSCSGALSTSRTVSDAFASGSRNRGHCFGVLARTPKQWPRFRLPEAKASLTVLDVLNAPEQERNDMLREWAKAVWSSWELEHTKVAEFVQERLHV